MGLDETQLLDESRLSEESTRIISYKPLNESEAVELSVAMIYKHLAAPTKNGCRPTMSDCLKFLNLCRSRQLNPWAGDCFMLGYDTKHEGPKFELIVAYQALLKRAENSPQFDGLEGGILVKNDNGIEDRIGAFFTYDESDRVVGGWARAYRKDRKHPSESRVRLEVYTTGRSRWAKDKGGMITKVAKAAVLREAFPNALVGLYIDEEMQSVHGETQLLEHEKDSGGEPNAVIDAVPPEPVGEVDCCQLLQEATDQESQEKAIQILLHSRRNESVTEEEFSHIVQQELTPGNTEDVAGYFLQSLHDAGCPEEVSTFVGALTAAKQQGRVGSGVYHLLCQYGADRMAEVQSD